eukprot:5737501-Amphidinium_carterae.1
METASLITPLAKACGRKVDAKPEGDPFQGQKQLTVATLQHYRAKAANELQTDGQLTERFFYCHTVSAS